MTQAGERERVVPSRVSEMFLRKNTFQLKENFRRCPTSLFFFVLFHCRCPTIQRKLSDHYISVLAATMSDSEEPLSSTPLDEVPVSEIGELLLAPLATVEQGEEMELI